MRVSINFSFKLLLLLQLLINPYLFSFEDIDNDNPLVIPNKNFNVNDIIEKININAKWFTDSDTEKLKSDIKKNQNAIDNDISNIKRIISELVLTKQNLLKYYDIQKIKEQIREKTKSISQINDEIRKDLTNVSFKGLFLVIQKDINILDSKEKLSSFAEKLISPKAVVDLNGIFISSLSIVKDYKTTYDYIKSIINGQMSIYKKYIAKSLRKDKIFLYLAKVDVSPLKNSIELETEVKFVEDDENNLVVNLMNEKDYKRKLKAFGVSNEIISIIEEEILLVKNTILNENYVSQENQKKIIKKGNSNIIKLKSEITKLEANVIKRVDEYKKTVNEKTDIVFDENNFEGSLLKAINYFTKEIQMITNELLIIKEKELFIQITRVISEGKPAEDIAKNTLSIIQQIQSSYGKIEQFYEALEVENFMTTSYKSGQEEEVFRKIDKVWIYPVPGNNDDFSLAVVAKFKIKGTKQLDNDYESIYEKYRSTYLDTYKIIEKNKLKIKSNKNSLNRINNEIEMENKLLNNEKVTLNQNEKIHNNQLIKKNRYSLDLKKHHLRNISSDLNSSVTSLEKNKSNLDESKTHFGDLVSKKDAMKTELKLLNSIYTRNDIVLRSSLFPGLGQFKSNRYLTGSIYSALFLGGITYYFYNYSESNTKQDEYDELYVTFKSAFGDEKLSLSNKLEEISNDINEIQDKNYIAIGIISGIYIANVIDAIFFTPADPKAKKLKHNIGLNRSGQLEFELTYKW